MKAIKENKVYTINETEKSYYISQGYDIVNDDGEIESYGAGKSVSYEEYRKVKDKLDLLETENEKLKEENKKLKAENKELKKS